MEITHERRTLGNFDPITEQEHLRRYEYVVNLVTGKDVLDIACGTGYKQAARRALRRFGAYAFIHRALSSWLGLEVQKRDHGVARFRVVRCEKPAN